MVELEEKKVTIHETDFQKDGNKKQIQEITLEPD
jgi:hypothetical protein